MAHKKSAGVSKNGRDSNPKYLGIKVNHGESARAGSVLVRQRCTGVLAGKNVSMGKDHTLFSIVDGKVSMGYKRKVHFDNSVKRKKIISVETA